MFYPIVRQPFSSPYKIYYACYVFLACVYKCCLCVYVPACVGGVGRWVCVCVKCSTEPPVNVYVIIRS